MTQYLKLPLATSWLLSSIGLFDEKIAVVFGHEKNSGETVRRLGTIIQRPICPIRSRNPLEFLEIVRGDSVPRSSFSRIWKLSSRLFPRPDWLPLPLRGLYTSRERNESKPWIKTRLPFSLKHITEESDLENFQDLVVALDSWLLTS